jgi:hypothetical protein
LSCLCSPYLPPPVVVDTLLPVIIGTPCPHCPFIISLPLSLPCHCPLSSLVHHHSTHGPPPEQLLMGLGVGGCDATMFQAS